MTNVSDRVSVEDYVALRERAERAEKRLRDYDKWLFGLAPTAGTHRAMRKYVERCVALAQDETQVPS